MNPNELREFANRDWTQLSNMDRSYWAAEHLRKGFISTQKAAWVLWLHMKSIRPEWPDAAERQRDIDHHMAQKQLLIQVSDGYPPH